MTTADLEAIANRMVGGGRGILAADESSGTANKRLTSVKVEPTEDNRRDYREMLFRTPDLGKYISGTILYDETLRQSAADGTPFTKILADQDIMPGIKVDTGAMVLAGSPNEKITEGLDGLRDRLNEYVGLGSKFTKWRAVITIGDCIPTSYCIEANAHLLARFAALSQEANLVPIVEPEVLMDGDHTIDQCFEVTEATLRETYAQRGRHGVSLEGSLLKPNMVLSGKDASRRADAEEVAEKTLKCFSRSVPAAVPGVVFLSGGQSDEEATLNLDAISRLGSCIVAKAVIPNNPPTPDNHWRREK